MRNCTRSTLESSSIFFLRRYLAVSTARTPMFSISAMSLVLIFRRSKAHNFRSFGVSSGKRCRRFLKKGEIAEGVASAYGARAQCHYTRLYPALLNHEQQALAVKEIVRNWLGEEGLKPAPQQMTAEDFAFMTQVCPGCLFRLGIRDPKHTASLHECEFDFNDEATLYGSTLMVLIALNRLKAVNA